MKDSRFLRLLTFGVAAWLLSLNSLLPAADRKPNIIFIMADDLGYGDLGCYGQKTIQTPNIDRLATEGMQFSDFYAGSTVCAPSRCVLMTGYHTGHCFIRGNGKDNLRPGDVTVAEVLKKAGYATGMFGKWGLGHEGSSGLPTRQGFDQFFGYLDQHHAHNFYPSFLIEDEKRFPLKNVVPNEGQWGQGKASVKKEYSHDLIMERALRFVDQHHEKPFFLYLPITIPHANNEARNEGMEIPDYGIYAERDWPEPQKGHAAMITRMDSDVGLLMNRLKKYGIDENTIVFFTSDNGPHREGGNNPDFQDSNGPLNGIKRALTDGGIRVPMIARWPGQIEAGSRSNHIGAFWDMMPTFAELAGVSDGVPKDTDGISFVPTLRGKDQRVHQNLFWVFFEQKGARALRKGNWKVVQQPIHSAVRLYDLSQDLGEKVDLAARHPDLVQQLVAEMDSQYVPMKRWQFPKPRAKKGNAGKNKNKKGK
ncbi:MAG: arylsulfatase [Planctomycetota bacterium]|nr:arylsulfatase [Planctomycetota bacterium]